MESTSASTKYGRGQRRSTGSDDLPVGRTFTSQEFEEHQRLLESLYERNALAMVIQTGDNPKGTEMREPLKELILHGGKEVVLFSANFSTSEEVEQASKFNFQPVDANTPLNPEGEAAFDELMFNSKIMRFVREFLSESLRGLPYQGRVDIVDLTKASRDSYVSCMMCVHWATPCFDAKLDLEKISGLIHLRQPHWMYVCAIRPFTHYPLKPVKASYRFLGAGGEHASNVIDILPNGDVLIS
jgi:hypothetical protein